MGRLCRKWRFCLAFIRSLLAPMDLSGRCSRFPHLAGAFFVPRRRMKSLH